MGSAMGMLNTENRFVEVLNRFVEVLSGKLLRGKTVVEKRAEISKNV